jgi:hypothetical protein
MANDCDHAVSAVEAKREAAPSTTRHEDRHAGHVSERDRQQLTVNAPLLDNGRRDGGRRCGCIKRANPSGHGNANTAHDRSEHADS